ncbi:uncharacterized protein A1O9_10383 [Exophiala aquamarina CBS 119918]|uniref:Sensitive to high expression protein 9, mitochondrial n=1 Tax=Exophiala aquamarina CBS 119918 TaxID=1182545 RepID=A0A072P2A2_9EURO|nr:uncharacterized protein A1O9_10383 [Exophiala aquamarina CBS 119918]KEF53408.1 hypothetical protein A1O9_10383 [Exophiala aquamarina CBS 119918]
MQQTPLRLFQTLWSAFRAAKPTSKQLPRPVRFNSAVPRSPQRWNTQSSRIIVQARFYSNNKTEINRKAGEAKSRIGESLDARVEAAAQSDQKLRDAEHEAIVHTIPEASSTVHTSEDGIHGVKHGSPSTPQPRPPNQSSSTADKFLPSDFSQRYSQMRKQFTHFMDNFQTHVFTASKRLNDLTGYSGIEALKKEIEVLETEVQASRKAVKESRNIYSEAIATRSTTQREVNDLLHRKHTWSPTDIERFTNLYRSDHANEQAEAAAQKDVADAEARYEEASTKLGKSILARYHEEQIWSDKIRQMSTWGTWGLMGLNVLLFVIFQIAIEPWRRRRLVKGFEEKVEIALKERDDDLFNAATAAARAPTQTVQPNQSSESALADLSPQDQTEAVADNIAEQIVDAISGASDVEAQPVAPPSTPISPSLQPPTASTIEAAAEQLTAHDLTKEEITQGHPASPIPIEALDPQPPTSSTESPSSPLSASASRWTASSSPFASYEDWIRSRFSDDRHVLLTQRELSTVAMEGFAGGMALMGLLFVLLRPR